MAAKKPARAKSTRPKVPPRTKDVDALDVSVATFALMARVGKNGEPVTRQAVYKWIDAGLPYIVRSGERRIVLSQAIPWLVEYRTWEYQEQRRLERKDIPNLKDEKALEARASRLLREHELHVTTREFLPRTALSEVADRVIGHFSGTAAGRLRTYHRDIVRARSIADASRITQNMHRDLMAGALQYGTQLEDEARDLARQEALVNVKVDDGRTDDASTADEAPAVDE